MAILNFALTLEYLEEAYYDAALRQVKGLSGEAKSLATTLRDNESAHVDALTTAIKGAGGKPVAAPEVDFGMAFGSEKSFLKLAQTFEDTGVSAYNGAGPLIESKDILAAAGKHRSGGGSPCGGHPAAERRPDHGRRVRQGA